MTETTYTAADRVKNILYLFVLLFLVWLAVTSSFHWQELSVGIVISLVLSLFLNKYYLELGLPVFSIKRMVFFAIYSVVLFIEIIKANFDVAYRVIHPKLPIKPGIVIIKTELKQEFARMLLANSITLTPGTFTLDVLGDRLLIHWINVQSEDTAEATRMIGERFEKYLKVIFA